MNVLKEKVSTRRANWSDYFKRQAGVIKKSSRKLYKSARPFLTPKYWPIYLVAFGIGFYLWGPAHGLLKIQNWSHRKSDRTPNSQSIGTLQQELTRLKKEIELTRKSEPVFDPTSFSRPALGEVIEGFEWSLSGNSWRLHPGVDLKTPAGGNVIAAAAGAVTAISKTATGCFSVTVNHGSGWESFYSNLATVQVVQGQKVIKGIIIGTSSLTGCNSNNNQKISGFHFGIYLNREPVDPQNIIAGISKL